MRVAPETSPLSFPGGHAFPAPAGARGRLSAGERVVRPGASSTAVGGARARAVFARTRTRTRTEVEPGRNPKTPPINIAENYPARVRDDDTEKIRKRENVYFMTTSGTVAARRARATLARAPVRSRTMSPWRERGRERGRPRDEPPGVRALDIHDDADDDDDAAATTAADDDDDALTRGGSRRPGSIPGRVEFARARERASGRAGGRAFVCARARARSTVRPTEL